MRRNLVQVISVMYIFQDFSPYQLTVCNMKNTRLLVFQKSMLFLEGKLTLYIPPLLGPPCSPLINQLALPHLVGLVAPRKGANERSYQARDSLSQLSEPSQC